MKTTKLSNSFTILLIILGTIGIAYWMIKPHKSKYDLVDRENPKMAVIFNEQIPELIRQNTKGIWAPGLSETSRQSTIDFLQEIKSIETFATHGVKSSKPRNYLKINLVLQDGSEFKNLYTGKAISKLFPHLLLKISMENGKVTKVLTNGVELKNSPSQYKNEALDILKSTLSFDKRRNKSKYYPQEKSQDEIDKEWENY